MDRHDFLSIMQLADADARVADDSIVGIALVVVHRNAKGELELQIGSTHRVEEALFEAIIDAAAIKRKTRHG